MYISHKRIIAGCGVAIALFFIFAVHMHVYAADTDNYVFEGHGTQYDPYLITSYEDICALRDMVDAGQTFNGVYFKQKADIIFPDQVVWNPIGDLQTGLSFDGYYNGNGYHISNIRCADAYAGLFSLLGGEVRNLGIESGLFTGDYIGSITSHGTGSARIINCYNKAEVRGTARAGGIADNFPGMIMFCWNLGGVYGESAESITAGICSYDCQQISYCYDTVNDRLTDEAVFSGTIEDSVALNADDAAVAMEQMYVQMWDTYLKGGGCKSRQYDLYALAG